MTDREAIAGLLDRVRNATGPDREIDAELRWLERPLLQRRPFAEMKAVIMQNEAAPPYTSSLDAIVALIERELPDRNRASGNNHVLPASKSQAYADIPPYFAYVGDGRGNATVLRETGQTEALALCAAFLSALSAKLETPTGETK